ncbi:MAG TPA: CsgG/HfaB family protein [Candidatus Latescibacteria bacterium]|nr:CsgG/HfaB family protein [Candidatus Latescibacterota bacterium]
MPAGRRSNSGSLWIAVVLAVSGSSCGVLATQPYRSLAPVPPVQDRDQAVQIIVAALTERGYSPALVNERVGTVSTDWRMTAGWMKIFFGYSGQDRVVVSLSDSTLILNGEYQVRKGTSLVSAMFHDREDRHRQEPDTDWFTANPPASLRQEWEQLRLIIAERISRAAPARRATVAGSASPVVLPPGEVVAPSVLLRRQPAEQRIAVAVVDFKGVGVSRDEVAILTDRLRAELVDSGIFMVIERERMEEILREQEFQVSGACESDACVVEIGRLVGVNRIITGTIGKLGSTYTTTARLINVETGEIVARASDDCACEVEQLLGRMERIAGVLANGAN